MPLTDPACKNSSCPPDKARAGLADSGGLYLEVLPGGGNDWRWKYRFLGAGKRLALGVYPAVTIKAARKARDEARTALEAGNDPAQLMRETKLLRQLRASHTFEGVAREWWAQWKDQRNARPAEHVRRRLEADVFPAIGARAVAEVTAPHMIALTKKIESRGAADLARRAMQVAGQVLRCAVAHGVIERSSAATICVGEAFKSRRKENFARLSAKELFELMRKITSTEATS